MGQNSDSRRHTVRHELEFEGEPRRRAVVSIDWLKLEADNANRTGAFSDIEVVQRVYTGGGKAPASSCKAHQVYESAYTAHYYFWSSMRVE